MTELASSQLAAISRLFSSSVICELARKGKSPLFARLAQESLLISSPASGKHVYSLFDTAFSVLQRVGCRAEYVYKAALTHKILLGKHSLQTASMLTEFRVGGCKADTAILNGTSTVYEIKSERDSLARLQRQISTYATVFARVYVIAGENHVASVLASVPSSVGVLRLNRRNQISTVQDAADRANLISPAAIFDSIRLAEARAILLSLGVSVPVVPNTELSRALRELFLGLSPLEAHHGMVRVLKKTRDLRPLSSLVSQLPRSLQPAALSIPMRKSDHLRLVNALNTSLDDAMEWA
ncbi:sce7726 family protein [Steroidobacter cummioxidans]|uniref:sce7726 family protein n=1 Tax=Steroidobacter cummioxidans TaxID=1803913 RepID=UPI000E3120F0|nr:sce7726 family protein [Steroidobacter cummioxidans]